MDRLAAMILLYADCNVIRNADYFREFIERDYISLKKANPNTPILVRECSGIEPKLWARYGMSHLSFTLSGSDVPLLPRPFLLHYPILLFLPPFLILPP